MKILFLCHRFPFPPRRGGKIRPFQMVRHLHASGHEVTVCSLVRSEAEARAGAGLAEHCSAYHMIRVREPVQVARMVASVGSAAPSSLAYFHSPELARLVWELLARQRFDRILVHCSSMAQYVENVPDIPKVLDFGDMDSQKWLAYAQHKPFPVSRGYEHEGRRLMREEKRLTSQFDLCTTTTAAELDTLRSYGTAAPSLCIPNGVDAEYFCPGEEPYDPDTISFIGLMSYYPNQQCMRRFCDEAWPIIRAHRPHMKLLIVGGDPPASVRALAHRPGVEVTGTVPDVRPYVRRSTAMVAPLAIARGTQNKILEAMAMGVPVITSSIAAGGVNAEPGRHLIVADDADEIACAVLRLASDREERARLAAAGRERMLSHHAWASSMELLDDVLDRCAHRPAPRSRREATGMQP